MRLVCPNCDAEYEVTEDAIPDAGRDVQCSNCGHAWFQMSLMREAEDEATSAVFDPPPGFDLPHTEQRTAPPAARDTTMPVTSATFAPVAESRPETGPLVRGDAGLTISGIPNQVLSDVILPDAVDPGLTAAHPAAPNPIAQTPPDAEEYDAFTTPPSPRTIDDSVLAVLREEAEREIAARRDDAAPRLETQTEMPLSAPQAPPAGPELRGAARHIARMKGLDPDAADAAPPPTEATRAPDLRTADPLRPSARRDLLPDIEEINSTLRASNDRSDLDRVATRQAAAGGAPRNAPRDGFRSGFILTLMIAVLLVVCYAMAPRLSAQFPQVSGTLQGYVAMIDAARLWLDGAMRTVIGMLEG